MAPEDDTLPLMGEADSTEYEEASEPDVEPETSQATTTDDGYRERYDNLHGAFSRQGNELGSLRQELDAIKRERESERDWRREQDRTTRQRAPEDPDREAILNRFIRNPNAFYEEQLTPKLSPLQKKLEALEEWKNQSEQQRWLENAQRFASEHSDFNRYQSEIDSLVKRGYPIDGAYYTAKALAGQKGEESARKKAKALTQGAAVPKSVAPSRSSKTAKKAKTFEEARRMAEADAQGG